MIKKLSNLWYEVTWKQMSIPIALVSFVIGTRVGLSIREKQLREEYEELAQSEIAEAKRFYARFNKAGVYSSPEGAVADLIGPTALIDQTVRDLGYTSDDEDTDEVDEPTNGRPELTPDVVDDLTWNQAAEEASRSEDIPYVISQDEYMEGERDYTQITLTYFEGDDTLVDDHDEPIIDPDTHIGGGNLERFGHGSKDNTIVYIRNDRLECDFEIVHNSGEYVKEVLGVLEHSDKRGPRRMRREYG